MRELVMETISVQVSASLFAAIYERFGEETGATINGCLRQLLDSSVPDPRSGNEGTPQYPRPRPGTITGRVWEIADHLEQETRQATREAVVKTCISEGININTASTQYSHWQNALRDSGATGPRAAGSLHGAV